jgi:hypothetical protein
MEVRLAVQDTQSLAGACRPRQVGQAGGLPVPKGAPLHMAVIHKPWLPEPGVLSAAATKQAAAGHHQRALKLKAGLPVSRLAGIRDDIAS